MNTISVTVEQPTQAFMLVEWLKNIRFVKAIDVKSDKKGNAGEIIRMLDSMKTKKMFSDITDPVAYQKQLRDEWER